MRPPWLVSPCLREIVLIPFIHTYVKVYKCKLTTDHFSKILNFVVPWCLPKTLDNSLGHAGKSITETLCPRPPGPLPLWMCSVDLSDSVWLRISILPPSELPVLWTALRSLMLLSHQLGSSVSGLSPLLLSSLPEPECPVCYLLAYLCHFATSSLIPSLLHSIYPIVKRG